MNERKSFEITRYTIKNQHGNSFCGGRGRLLLVQDKALFLADTVETTLKVLLRLKKQRKHLKNRNNH